MIENESSINNEINNDGPKLKAIVKEDNAFYPDISAESHMINNKIVVWYTLEQTLDYLKNRNG